MTEKTSTFRSIASLLGIGILSVVGLGILRNYAGSSTTSPVHWMWILVSLAFDLLIYWFGALGWIYILAEMGEVEQSKAHWDNYWVSLPFQWVSGLLGSSLGRFWLSGPLTIKRNTLAGALLVEKSLAGACSLLSIVSLTLMGFLLRTHPGTFVPFIALLIFFVLAGFALSRSTQHPSRQSKFKILVLYLCTIQACGFLALYALSKAIGHSSPLDFILLTRAYFASWFLSQLAFIVPQGLAVREAIFAYFMRSSTGVVWPIQFALYVRMLSVAAQILASLFFRNTFHMKKA